MGNPMMLMMGLMVIGMTVFPKLLGAFARESRSLYSNCANFFTVPVSNFSFFHRRHKPHLVNMIAKWQART